MTKIIGAGFGRPGTYSLKLALEQLTGSPCYHMFDLIKHPESHIFWPQVDQTPKVLDQLLDGYDSIVDFPGCLHLKTLLNHYPNAKVILTLRSAEQWYESALKTIINPYQVIDYMFKRGIRVPFSSRERSSMRMYIYMRKRIHEALYQNNYPSKAQAIASYKRHIDYVQKLVPENQLLSYEITTGWQPLCEFLELDIPSSTFPNTNPRSHYQQLLKRFSS
jgi:hypothetical protein